MFVIESAQQESVNTIWRCRLKIPGGRKNLWWGCLVERFRDEIRKRILKWMRGWHGELQNILVRPASRASGPKRFSVRGYPLEPRATHARRREDFHAANGRGYCRPA